MISKIKKIFHYIVNYRQNKARLAMLEEAYTFPLYQDHFQRTIKYNCVNPVTSEQLLSRIVLAYHTIEKGLNKPNVRLGFGAEVVRELIKLCNTYATTYADRPQRLLDAINVLKAYVDLHNKASYQLDVADSISELVNKYQPLPAYHLSSVTRDAYFSIDQLDFEMFAKSRHSIRDFDGSSVAPELINQAIALAQTAPSACNRQSVRIYVVWNPEKLQQLCQLQRGGRGFIDQASPLIVVAYDMQDWIGGEQWCGGYIDAGIYLMNLLYALHYHKIAACPLNWYATIEENWQLHQLLSIPESQAVVAIVACGNAKEQLNLVNSNRLSIDEIKTDIW